MIHDIPSKADFDEQGFSLLNLGWEAVTTLLLDLGDMKSFEDFVDADQEEEYRRASQKPLAIATALLQQGTELLLKGAIANISPYLLISGSAQSWPKKCDSRDTSFSEFHTPDAVELIRIHDTVAERRLSEAFKQQFEKLRRTRNTIFHTVDRNLRFSNEEILESILLITSELCGPEKWFQIRQRYLDSTPSAAIVYDDIRVVLIREFAILRDILGKAALLSHFGFNKTQRVYTCLECRSKCRSCNIEIEPKTAQLKPNLPMAETVHCVVCHQSVGVIRQRCGWNGCEGNVIAAPDSDWDTECLTCGEIVEIEE